MPADNGRPQYWFRAKRYGWGWGLPLTWQGWVVFVGWFAVFIPAMVRLLPRRPVAFMVFTLVMGLLLTVICYITGEPPRWRSGDPAE
ncbi:MAG TPA: hypothetical protein VMA54_16130 [Steroidobacteraceae bacterium]|nr:hypothetical protein [Steroidobacteraceae bacterium]